MLLNERVGAILLANEPPQARNTFSNSLKRFLVKDAGIFEPGTNTVRNELRVVLLVESPHTDEVKLSEDIHNRYPLAGRTGRDVRGGTVPPGPSTALLGRRGARPAWSGSAMPAGATGIDRGAHTLRRCGLNGEKRMKHRRLLWAAVLALAGCAGGTVQGTGGADDELREWRERYPVVVRDGLRYAGDVRDGKPHGRGVLLVPGSGGYHYEGEFRDGAEHGHGVKTGLTLGPAGAGWRYEGGFRAGLLHGAGVLVKGPGGQRIEGE